ncbi:MAG: FKBP-type peptidyl-prolyl cis-trans isomerase [Microbacterium sp.]|uniref:FKBP-type peptidyl-prolyl cis-trans isomerase n=1 Tax=Microbacterium sp. TaxID=51671 RepID=UPI003A8A5959
MRIRPLLALSAVAITGVLLAGCASTPDEPEVTSTPDANCMLDAAPGSDSDAIEVEGTAPTFTATVPEGLEFADIQRTVISEGTGDDLQVGDLVSGSYTVLDATTGDVLTDSSTQSPDDTGFVPMLLDAQNYSIFVAALECLPAGSTVAMTIPGSAFGDGGTPVAIIASSSERLSTRAEGEAQDPVDGMPTVELADDGAPTITLPGGDAPTEVQIAELKVGDGPVVEPGDTAFVQYTGVKWSDGTVFDSSWDRGSAAAFSTTGVVDGFRQALEGQTVGSQVLVVIPPAFAYGEGEINENDLTGETLVFVVDILGVERAVTG